MTKNIKVELGGTDSTSYLKKSVKTTTYGDAIAKYEFEFTKNLSTIVTPSNALTVIVYLDSSDPPTTKVFDGFIDLFEPQGAILKITSKDQLATLINKQIQHEYINTDATAGKLSAIFNDMVTNASYGGGMSTNAGATIQDSGTELTLEKFICRNADIFERCKKLAETLNWVFYYRADTGYVYFEPKNYTTNANTLTVGSNVIEIPNWEYDRSEMINDLRVEGAQQLVQASEVFTGDGAEVHFTLAHIPESIEVYYAAAKNYGTTAKIQSEYKIGDVPDSTSTHDYEIDKKQKLITFTSFVPAAGTNNILAEVSYYAPIPIHMTNDASKLIYGTYAKTLILTDVLSLEDAWKRGQNILEKYKVPFKSAKLKVLWSNSLNLVIGQQILVIDNVNTPTVNQYFTIYKIIDYWPEGFTEIEVGDKQYTIDEYQANLLERVKRLEETVVGPTDALSEIIQANITFDFVPDTTNVLVQNINNSWILGLDSNSILGTTMLGDRNTDYRSDVYTWISGSSYMTTTMTLTETHVLAENLTKQKI